MASVFVSDDEFVEGVLGGLGWLFGGYYFKSMYEKENVIMTGFIAWNCMWLTRKIGMHVYGRYKNHHNLGRRGLAINNIFGMEEPHHSGFVLAVLFAIGYLLLVRNNPVDDSLVLFKTKGRLPAIFMVFVVLACMSFTPLKN